MTTNSALKELESSADIDEAKRDLVLRFVRDQESLQTSQVDLKLVDDNTIDLIDSNLGKDENHNDTTTSKDSATVSHNREDGHLVAPRPPSGRPRSRRLQRKSSYDTSTKKKTHYETTDQRKISLSRVHSHSGVISASGLENIPLTGNKGGVVDRLEMSSPNAIGMERLTMSAGMDRITRPMSPPPIDHDNTDLNCSWPQQEFMARKLSNSRKYVLYTPENNDSRPLSTQSHKVVYGNTDRSRSSSPTKKNTSRNRGRTFMNLNIEPVHPSEISLLRGASASSSVSGPYTLVQLPPIQTTPPSI